MQYVQALSLCLAFGLVLSCTPEAPVGIRVPPSGTGSGGAVIAYRLDSDRGATVECSTINVGVL